VPWPAADPDRRWSKGELMRLEPSDILPNGAMPDNPT
jgi:hypothetical protein